MAVGTITFEHYQIGAAKRIVATCTASSTDGSFPATALPAFSGTIVALISNPGSTAPTDDYDFTLADGDGLDRLNGAGQNRDTTTSERVRLNRIVAASDTLTLTITGNSVNSAVTVITFVYSPEIDSGGEPLTAGTAIDRSGTIAAGGTAQALMSANAFRKWLLIQNVDSAEDLWFNFTTTAVADKPSIKLVAGQSYESAVFVPSEAISVIAATTGHKYTAKEG